MAENASKAAHTVKCMPRVKRDHEDAILWVNEVTYYEYVDGQKLMETNPYFHCNSKSEQKLVMELIAEGIRQETEKQLEYRERKGYAEHKSKCKTDKNGIRNPYKYARYNAVYDWNYEIIGA